VSGDYDLAEQAILRVLEFKPDHVPAYGDLGVTALYRGDPAGTLDALAQSSIESSSELMDMAIAYYQLGREDEFLRARQRLIDEFGDLRPASVARVEAVSGRIDSAFEWLDRHLAQPAWQRGISYRSPFFDNLRGDPRWDRYLTQMGVSDEQLAAINFRPTLPF
jgi:hypothetical protein